MTTPGAGSPLRLRMIEDMVARKPALGRSAAMSSRASSSRSPETATPDDVRNFQRHLIDSGRSVHYRNRMMTGVKFLLKVTMRRHDLVAEIYHLREPQAVAVVLAPAPAATTSALRQASAGSSPAIAAPSRSRHASSTASCSRRPRLPGSRSR